MTLEYMIAIAFDEEFISTTREVRAVRTVS